MSRWPPSTFGNMFAPAGATLADLEDEDETGQHWAMSTAQCEFNCRSENTQYTLSCDEHPLATFATEDFDWLNPQYGADLDLSSTNDLDFGPLLGMPNDCTMFDNEQLSQTRYGHGGVIEADSTGLQLDGMVGDMTFAPTAPITGLDGTSGAFSYGQQDGIASYHSGTWGAVLTDRSTSFPATTWQAPLLNDDASPSESFALCPGTAQQLPLDDDFSSEILVPCFGPSQPLPASDAFASESLLPSLDTAPPLNYNATSSNDTSLSILLPMQQHTALAAQPLEYGNTEQGSTILESFSTDLVLPPPTAHPSIPQHDRPLLPSSQALLPAAKSSHHQSPQHPPPHTHPNGPERPPAKRARKTPKGMRSSSGITKQRAMTQSRTNKSSAMVNIPGYLEIEMQVANVASKHNSRHGKPRDAEETAVRKTGVCVRCRLMKTKCRTPFGSTCNECLKALQCGGTNVGGTRFTACLHKFADVMDYLQLEDGPRKFFIHYADECLGLRVPDIDEDSMSDVHTFDRIISYLDDFTLKQRWCALTTHRALEAVKGFIWMWCRVTLHASVTTHGCFAVELFAYYTRMMCKSMSVEMKLRQLAWCTTILDELVRKTGVGISGRRVSKVDYVLCRLITNSFNGLLDAMFDGIWWSPDEDVIMTQPGQIEMEQLERMDAPF